MLSDICRIQFNQKARIALSEVKNVIIKFIYEYKILIQEKYTIL